VSVKISEVSVGIGEVSVTINPQSLRFIGGYLYSTLRVVIIGEMVGFFSLRTLKSLKSLRREVVIIGEAPTKNNACYIEMCTRYLINTKVKTVFYCVSAGFSGVFKKILSRPSF
jgi:hypothetical protein